jgi:hypothetical protein
MNNTGGSDMCNSCSPTLLYRLVLGSLDYYVPRVIRSTTVYKFTGVSVKLRPHMRKIFISVKYMYSEEVSTTDSVRKLSEKETKLLQCLIN